MRGKYKADIIARWFLSYNDEQMMQYDADYISNLKLQKLLYYAQGCYLALTGTPLFDDEIVAWEHGPVVPSIYHEYKSNGSRGIEDYVPYEHEINSQEDIDILKNVYDVFGQYSAWGLRNMTHEETPWKETRRNDVIPQEKIRSYFVEHYIES